MTMFPIGTLLRLIRLARAGSGVALVCLVAFGVGVGLIVAGVIAGTGVLLVPGVLLAAVGLAGSRPGIGGL